jgi:hypothetical protein
MFGMGTKNTSYAFLAAAAFLFAGGEQYHLYAAICLVLSVVLAYMKINEVETDLQRAWESRDIDDRGRDFTDEMTQLRREIADLHRQGARK